MKTSGQRLSIINGSTICESKQILFLPSSFIFEDIGLVCLEENTMRFRPQLTKQFCRYFDHEKFKTVKILLSAS